MIGIFGCFLGISIGLMGFRTNDIQGSVPELVDGIKTAFWASVAGVGGALLIKMRLLVLGPPDVLFDSGKADLKQRILPALCKDTDFKEISRVDPRSPHRRTYVELLANALSEQDAYFQNKRLPQDRTRPDLEFVMKPASVADEFVWLRIHVTANGLSYSKRLMNPKGSENFARSQRVKFRVLTDADKRLEAIIENSK